MATNKIYLGILTLVILTSSFYIYYPEKIRIDFEKTRTIFKTYDNGNFVSQGTEYVRIFNGTRKKLANYRNLSFSILGNKSVIVRNSTFGNINLIDTYTFDGNEKLIENVPVSHEICVSNAKNLILEYLLSGINYEGVTKTISSPFRWGVMKLTFQDGYYLAKVYSQVKDKIVIRYKVPSDYECYDIRLFDPTGGLTMYLNGDNSSSYKKYEYFTTANITVNFSTGATNLVCVDIDDNIHNLSISGKNYTCGNATLNFPYQIATLRENKFNDSVTSKKPTTNVPIYISIDNRTDLVGLQFNLSGTDISYSDIDAETSYYEDGLCEYILPTDCSKGHDENWGTYTYRGGTGWRYIYENTTIDDSVDVNWTISFQSTAGCNLTLDFYNYSSSSWVNLLSYDGLGGGSETKTYLIKKEDTTSTLQIKTGFESSSGSCNALYYEGKVNYDPSLNSSSSPVNLNTSTLSLKIVGSLIGQNEYLSEFLSSGNKYSILNLSFTSASSQTIYLNLSSQGNFTDRTGFLNFTINGFSVDTGNSFNNLHKFKNLSLMPHGNLSGGTKEFEVYENFFTNGTDIFNKYNDDSWMGDIYQYTGIGDFGGTNEWEKCDHLYTYNSFPQYSDWTNCLYAFRENYPLSNTTSFYLDELDLRDIGAFSMELGLYSRSSLGTHSGDNNLVYTSLQISDLTTDVEVLTCNARGNWVGGGACATPANDCYFNITAQKLTDTSWTVTYTYLKLDDKYGIQNGTSTSIVDISSLDSTQAIRFKFKGIDLSNKDCGHTQNYVRIKSINISGISLSRTSGYYINNGSYISEVLNVTPTNISKMIFNMTNMSLGGKIFTYLSNDNGSTWESATNGETHTFTSVGNIAKFKTVLNTSANHSSPIILDYRVQVIPSEMSGLTIKVGSNSSSMVIGVLNSSTSPKSFNGTQKDVNNYLNSTCYKENLTCLVPITFTSSSGGIVQISNLNSTQDINPIKLNHALSYLENYNDIPFIFTFSGTNLNMSNIKLDFLGSKNITVLAHTPDYSANDSKILQVKYSKFNVTLPYNVDYWEVFAKSKNDKGLSPYGQSSNQSIWTINSLAYEDNSSYYVKSNSSLNSCLNITFKNVVEDDSFRWTNNSLVKCDDIWQNNVAIDYGNWRAVNFTLVNNSYVSPIEIQAGKIGNPSHINLSIYNGTSNPDKELYSLIIFNTSVPVWGSYSWLNSSFEKENIPFLYNGTYWLVIKITHSGSTLALGNYYSFRSNSSNANSLHSSNQGVSWVDSDDTIPLHRIYSVPSNSSYEYLDSYYYINLTNTSQHLCNTSIGNTCSIWNYVDLTNCSGRFQIPYFFFSAICSDCAVTPDFDETNLVEW